MVELFFFWSGVVMWFILGPVIFLFSLLFVGYLWSYRLVPSIGNLRFAFFGKPKGERRSYLELWNAQYRWNYHYYTRGEGNKNFARHAIRRLTREARREKQKMR